MRPNQSRTSGAVGLVSSLTVVLVTLAVLQYRWSGQVSQAERDRLQAGLRTAVGQFHDQFLRTLQQLCSNLQMNPALIEKQDWQLYARGCKDRSVDPAGDSSNKYCSLPDSRMVATTTTARHWR